MPPGSHNLFQGTWATGPPIRWTLVAVLCFLECPAQVSRSVSTQTLGSVWYNELDSSAGQTFIPHHTLPSPWTFSLPPTWGPLAMGMMEKGQSPPEPSATSPPTNQRARTPWPWPLSQPLSTWRPDQLLCERGRAPPTSAIL